MINTLPKRWASLFQLMRGEVRELLDLVARDRPLSPAHLRERVEDLLDTVDGLEEGCLKALNEDPDYNPSPWSADDVVILTTFIPESEKP